MATWKRVVLDGETTSVNLGNSNLTQTNENRTYDFGGNALNFVSSSATGLFMDSSNLTFGSFGFQGDVNLRRSGVNFVLKNAEAELNAATFDVNSATEVDVTTPQLTMNTDEVKYILESNPLLAGAGGDFVIEQEENSGSDARPIVRLRKIDNVPANNNTLGSIRFEAQNDNSQNHAYSVIKSISSNVADGDEDGRFEVDVSDGGSLTNALRCQPIPSTTDKADGMVVHGRPLRHIVETYVVTFGGSLSVGAGSSNTKNMQVSNGSEFVVNRNCRLTGLTHSVFKTNGTIPSGSTGLFFRVFVNGVDSGFNTNETNVTGSNLTLTDVVNYSWNSSLQLNQGDRIEVLMSCSNTGASNMNLTGASSSLFISNDYD